MDTVALTRRTSMIIPFVMIIVQIFVFLPLPDMIAMHADGDLVANRWMAKYSAISISLFFVAPVFTILIAFLNDRNSTKKALDNENTKDRAIIVIIFTAVVCFVEFYIDYMVMYNVL